MTTHHRRFIPVRSTPSVRSVNEFSRKRLLGANRYFVLARPIYRAILRYKRSRTIELPVHHRFYLPHTFPTDCSFETHVTFLESHEWHTVSMATDKRSSDVSEKEKDSAELLYVWHASHRRSGRTTEAKSGPRRHGIGVTCIATSKIAALQSRYLSYNPRQSIHTYFSLKARARHASLSFFFLPSSFFSFECALVLVPLISRNKK